MSKFNEVLNHDEGIVREAARLVRDLEDALCAGKITEDEFKDLTHDVLSMSHIHEAMVDLNRKQSITAAFEKIVAIVGLGRLL